MKNNIITNAGEDENRSGIRMPELPHWKGFNLLEMFELDRKGDFREDDFRWIRDWGFNFVRLPLCFRLWIEDGDVYKIHEPMLEKLDRAVEWGGQYGLHVNLNLHRGPGYSVHPEFTEPYNLWKDKEAQDAFYFHWQMLARRYEGVSIEQLSFNLINEPALISETMLRGDYERVMRAAVKVIRRISPGRIIIVDGLRWGRDPVTELNDLGVVHSTRAYDPMFVTHHQAQWVEESSEFPEPAWPGHGWDRQRLEECYRVWAELVGQGVPVHCGEGGSYNWTGHKVVLDWMQDVLEILKELKIGFALWNFRGEFGILDSKRGDVAYEDFQGHKLDRKMLGLLQELT
ncbi:MAG: cellulase family glycosylhydrolase [Sedimentisphaerales bacterium]|nr:cellulase family glycosylhydrolase [Sedimentisphaerales bacterium]